MRIPARKTRSGARHVFFAACLAAPLFAQADFPPLPPLPAEFPPPDLSHPEAFVLDLINQNMLQQEFSRKAMEDYAFYEEVREFQHLKDDSLKPGSVKVSWNYYSKTYAAFRSVPWSVDGKDVSQEERDRFSLKEEKRLEKRRREREAKAARAETDSPRAPAPAPNPPQASGSDAPPSKGEGESPAPPPAAKPPSRPPRESDSKKVEDFQKRHSTPTEGTKGVTKATVRLGWVEVDYAAIARHFAFAYEGEDVHGGEPVFVVKFRKRENVEEPNEELKKALPPVEGRLFISRRENAVVRMEMRLLEGYRPQTGLRVKELSFSMRSLRVDGRHWVQSEIEFGVQASVFVLFRVHEHIKTRRYDFKVFHVDVAEGSP